MPRFLSFSALLLTVLVGLPRGAQAKPKLPEAVAVAPLPDVKEAVRLLQNNKPLSASLRLYDLLKGGQFPEQDIKIKYHLARSLEQLEMYHTAEYFFLKVVNKGPDTPYFKYALPKLVKMARYTGDETELLKVAPRVPVKAYPRGSKNKMYYLMARRAMAQDDLNQALTHLGQISSKSDLYMLSRYLEGIIYNKQGKLESAKRAFINVVRHPIVAEDRKGPRPKQALKDLSLLNIGRMYYKIERYDDASKYFALVPSDSPHLSQTVFEAEWSAFFGGEKSEAEQNFLGLQARLEKRERKEGRKRAKGKLPPSEYIPEWDYFRGLKFFADGNCQAVDQTLLAFEARTTPIVREISAFVKWYATKERLKQTGEAWEAYFGDVPAETVLPEALLYKISRNNDIAGIVSHLDLIDAELKLIGLQKPEWRNTVGALLTKIIERDRVKLERRGGKLMLAEMAHWSNTLQDLLKDSETVRFELVVMRPDYPYRIRCK